MCDQIDEERFFETLEKHGVSPDYPLFKGYIPSAIESMADRIHALENELKQTMMDVHYVKTMALKHYGKSLECTSVVLDLGIIVGSCDKIESRLRGHNESPKTSIET
jgi:hypothetical protein